VGALGGALIAGTYGDQGRGKLLTIGNLFFPATLLIFAFSQSILVDAGHFVGVGVTFVLQNAMSNTLVQVNTPDNMRGRIMSVYALVLQGMMRAGGMQADSWKHSSARRWQSPQAPWSRWGMGCWYSSSGHRFTR